MITVTEDPIDIENLMARATSPEDGAVATFLGVVRNNSGSKKVSSLLYEAYVPMVLKCFEKISNEVKEKWDVTNVSIAHRIGHLQVGETAVAVLAAARHRREALEACSYAIGRIKAVAPIWKKEFSKEGEPLWIECA